MNNQYCLVSLAMILRCAARVREKSVCVLSKLLRMFNLKQKIILKIKKVKRE